MPQVIALFQGSAKSSDARSYKSSNFRRQSKISVTHGGVIHTILMLIMPASSKHTAKRPASTQQRANGAAPRKTIATNPNLVLLEIVGLPLFIALLAAIVSRLTPSVGGTLASIVIVLEFLCAMAGAIGWWSARELARQSLTNEENLLEGFDSGRNLVQLLSVGTLLTHGFATIALLASIFLTVFWLLPALLFDILKYFIFVAAVLLACIFAVMTYRYIKALLAANKPLPLRVTGLVHARDAEHELWLFVDELAEAVGVLPPENMVLGLDNMLFLSERPLHLPDATLKGRTLFLSLPLLRVMGFDELRAAIVHELSHFKGVQARVSGQVMPEYRAMHDARLRQPEFGVWPLHPLIAGPSAALWRTILDAFAPVAAEFSRRRELAADQQTAEVMGVDLAAMAITRRYVTDGWATMARDAKADLARSGEPVTNESAHYERIARSGGELRFSLDALNAHRVSHPVDVHPTYAERIAELHGADLEAVLSAASEAVAPEESAIHMVPYADTLERRLTALLPENRPTKSKRRSAARVPKRAARSRA